MGWMTLKKQLITVLENKLRGFGITPEILQDVFDKTMIEEFPMTYMQPHWYWRKGISYKW